MVTAAAIVAHRFGRPLAEKNRAGTLYALEQRARRGHLQDQVLGRIAVAYLDRLCQRVDRNQPALRQRLAGDRAARQFGALALDFGGRPIQQNGRRTQQDHLRIRPVLGLRQQVGGDEYRVRAGIGDHQHFGRAGRHVDRGAIRIGRHLQLRLGDPGIAGAEQLVAFRHAGRAVSHGGDRLRAAQLEHAVHTGEPRRIQHRLIAAAVGARRRAQHHFAATGDVRRHAQHQRGRRQRRAAGRHVQADPADRSQHALHPHAGRSIDRHWLRCRGAMEQLDAGRRLANGPLQCGIERRLGSGKLGLIDLECIQRAAVVSRAQLPQRRVAILAHGRDDPSDAMTHVVCARLRRTRQRLAPTRCVEGVPVQDLHASQLFMPTFSPPAARTFRVRRPS